MFQKSAGTQSVHTGLLTSSLRLRPDLACLSPLQQEPLPAPPSTPHPWPAGQERSALGRLPPPPPAAPCLTPRPAQLRALLDPEPNVPRSPPGSRTRTWDYNSRDASGATRPERSPAADWLCSGGGGHGPGLVLSARAHDGLLDGCSPLPRCRPRGAGALVAGGARLVGFAGPLPRERLCCGRSTGEDARVPAERVLRVGGGAGVAGREGARAGLLLDVATDL